MSQESYEKLFKEADIDGSGSLAFSELSKMMRKKGYKQSDEEIKQIFNKADTSDDDRVSLEEYLAAMGQQPAEVHETAYMRSTFAEFDRNGNGTIDKAELQEVFKILQQDLPEDQINKIMEMADEDKNDTLNYEEFISYVYGQ